VSEESHSDASQPEGAARIPLLELKGISKRFGAVQAMINVNLKIYAGEVLALVGDNGAGKSTLVKAIAGIYIPDKGEILFEGKPVHFTGPRDPVALGISTVYQDLALCDNWTWWPTFTSAARRWGRRSPGSARRSWRSAPAR